MAATVVYFRGTREELRRQVSLLAAMLSGRAPDTHGVARSFLLAIGFAALSDIKDAYITKARGGTDEMGITWPPLKPETIANRRVGPGDTKIRARAGETKQRELARIQHAELIKQREKIRKRETARAFDRLRLSLPEAEAKRRAKIVGGLAATRETGRTKVQTLGAREVEILRDTNVLINSLSPGILSLDSYQKPSEPGGEEQIFELLPGQVIVGTNVIYAGTHQHGTEHVPARKFLPDDETPVPPSWWQRWIDVGAKALVASARRLFQ